MLLIKSNKFTYWLLLYLVLCSVFERPIVLYSKVIYNVSAVKYKNYLEK